MRYHCEFKECKCRKFKLHCNNLCFNCKHANICIQKKKNHRQMNIWLLNP